MAEVTVNRQRTNVIGSRRQILANVDIAADVDTLTLTGVMHIIEFVGATSETNNAIGATISGGVVTFQTGGAENNVLVNVIGQ